MVILNNNQMVQEFKKHYEYEQQSVLVNNPKIKAYFPPENYTETSPEFNLIYQKTVNLSRIVLPRPPGPEGERGDRLVYFPTGIRVATAGTAVVAAEPVGTGLLLPAATLNPLRRSLRTPSAQVLSPVLATPFEGGPVQRRGQ